MIATEPSFAGTPAVSLVLAVLTAHATALFPDLIATSYVFVLPRTTHILVICFLSVSSG